jgi:hypothetical protein
VEFEFVLARKSTQALQVRTLIFPLFGMSALDMSFEIGLSLKRSLVAASYYGTNERGDMDIVDM